MRVPAGAMAMTVMGEVVHSPGFDAAFPVAVTAILPGRRAIAHARFRSPQDREIADYFPRLRPALGARRELEGVAHGHALLEARATVGTLVFVQSHVADGGEAGSLGQPARILRILARNERGRLARGHALRHA